MKNLKNLTNEELVEITLGNARTAGAGVENRMEIEQFIVACKTELLNRMTGTLTSAQEYGTELISQMETEQKKQFDKEHYSREERKEARLFKEEIQAKLITWINCF